MLLDKKVAVVTGGASGIGRATVELFLREGARVLAVDRDVGALDKLRGEASDRSERLRLFECDVSDETLCKKAIADTVAAWQRVDVLVACAGFSPGLKLLDTSFDDWEKTFQINARGSFLWARECLREMTARKSGSIIMVASQRARAGGRASCAYVSSKGAILSLTMSIALDYADQGIRCNAILPGAIQTPMSYLAFERHPNPDEAMRRSLARHPMGRHGKPDEVAHAALYLASDASSFVTGVELPIDGGWLAG